MSQMKIKFNRTSEVEEFVRAAAKCNFDVDIIYNSTVVDAKSFLGIASLGLGKALTVYCHGEDFAFLDTIRKFAVAA